MTLTFDAAVLSAALKTALTVIPSRNSIPIIDCVRLSSAMLSNHATLTAFDLDVEITLTLPIWPRVEETAFDAYVPTKALLAMIGGAAKGSAVTLAIEPFETLNPNVYPFRLRISGAADAALALHAPADWPSFAAMAEKGSYAIPAARFHRLLSLAAPCISTEETRYYLNGVFLHVDRDKLAACATDGHRLSYVSDTLPDDALPMPRMILPTLLVKTALKVFAKAKDALTVAWFGDGVRIRLECGNVRLISKLIDGSFPDYHRVIPAGNDRLLTIDAEALAKAATDAARVTADRNRALRLSIAPGGVMLQAVNVDNGASFKTAVSATWSGAELDIGVNARYLVDMCKLVGKGEMTFALADAGSPIKITAPGLSGWLGVQMPMRV